MMKKLLFFVVFMLAAMPAQAWFWESKEHMPKISLPDAQGKLLKLPDDLQGKVLLIHFFGIDCHFCDKEMVRLLEGLYQKYKTHGFVVLSVNVGEMDKTDERWKTLLTSISYPLLVDEKGLAAKKMGVIGLPTTFVVDSAGVVQKKLTGEGKIAEYEELFTPFLSQGEAYENKSSQP